MIIHATPTQHTITEQNPTSGENLSHYSLTPTTTPNQPRTPPPSRRAPPPKTRTSPPKTRTTKDNTAKGNRQRQPTKASSRLAASTAAGTEAATVQENLKNFFKTQTTNPAGS